MPAFDGLDATEATAPLPAAVPSTIDVPVPPARPSLAYITVTDAAGRVLFRRMATAEEVDDALFSAGEATREGEAAMERIAYDRMFEEIVGEE